MRLVFPWVWCVGLVLVACVVTDEIQFDDRVNYPPLLISTDPPNDVRGYAQTGEVVQFTVTLWEPDRDDTSRYNARIMIVEYLNSTQSLSRILDSCQAPTTSEPVDEETGIIISITCDVEISPSNAGASSVVVRMETSDRGYLAGGQLADDARTLEVDWNFTLFSENAF